MNKIEVAISQSDVSFKYFPTCFLLQFIPTIDLALPYPSNDIHHYSKQHVMSCATQCDCLEQRMFHLWLWNVRAYTLQNIGWKVNMNVRCGCSQALGVDVCMIERKKTDFKRSPSIVYFNYSIVADDPYAYFFLLFFSVRRVCRNSKHSIFILSNQRSIAAHRIFRRMRVSQQ